MTTGRLSSNYEVDLRSTYPHCLAAPCLNICVRVACIIRAAVGVTILTTGRGKHSNRAQSVVAVAREVEWAQQVDVSRNVVNRSLSSKTPSLRRNSPLEASRVVDDQANALHARTTTSQRPVNQISDSKRYRDRNQSSGDNSSAKAMRVYLHISKRIRS